MEIEKLTQLRAIAKAQVDTAQKYAVVRKEAGDAETELKIILTSRLKELRGNKKNLGIEMAILMLCEDNSTAQDLFKIWKKKEAEYKGLERVLDAQGSYLIFEQSLLKYQREGEQYG